NDSFVKLINLLRTGGVTVECVVVPLPVAGLRLVSLQRYLQWMELVVQQCGTIWDFSLPGSITSDNYNYWDIDHFLPHVSKLMLVRVLDGDLPELTKYPNFGVRVSAVEFERHRERWETLTDALNPPTQP